MGGYQELFHKYPDSKPNLIHEGYWTAKPECFIPRLDFFHIFQDPVTGDLPWPGIVFGVSTLSLYYWCTDQVTRHGAAEVTALDSGGLQCIPGFPSLYNHRQQLACLHSVIRGPFQSLFIA